MVMYPPVPPHLSLYVYFVPFMINLPVFIPLLWQWVVIFISSLFIFTSPTWSNPRCLRPCTPYKHRTIWKWRVFPYCLVRRCYHRPWNCPPRVDGFSFHRLTVKFLGSGVRGGYVWSYMLEPFVVNWEILWEAARIPCSGFFF